MSSTATPSHPSQHLAENVRLRIIELVEEKGHTHAAVAEALGVHRNTIANTIAHFHAHGHARDLHAGGVHTKYNDEQLERLWDIILENDRLTAAALRRRMGDSAPHISLRTMDRYRISLGMTPRSGRVTAAAMLTHHTERWDWAWEHRRSPVATWIHSDESTLCMRDTGQVVWAPRGQSTPGIEVETLRCSINLFGCVWDGGHIFATYRGHLTSATFINLLEEHIVPVKENLGHRVFLMDRAPGHQAKATRAWLTAHDLDHMFLPPHSPQFNAIEECWAWIKRRVRQAEPATHRELYAATQAACDEIPSTVVRPLLQHAQKNVRAYAQTLREE
jgi:transposase